MSQTPPEWHPEQDAHYDAILGPGSAQELAALKAGTAADRDAFMRDTREVHHRLYAPFAPAGFPEYAGTYRGTPGTSLETRTTHAQCVTRPGEFYTFLAPEKVAGYLSNGLGSKIDELIAAPTTENPDMIFKRAAMVFYIFGLVHPYLDGNGHVQRLVFAAAVMQRPELTLLTTWSIHPRPYDVEIAAAFERRPNAADAVVSVLAQYVQR